MPLRQRKLKALQALDELDWKSATWIGSLGGYASGNCVSTHRDRDGHHEWLCPWTKRREYRRANPTLLAALRKRLRPGPIPLSTRQDPRIYQVARTSGARRGVPAGRTRRTRAVVQASGSAGLRPAID